MDKMEPYFGQPREPVPAPEASGPEKLDCDADGGELFGIHVISLFLTIITLGIYRFWWKTRVRRYMWSHFRYKDDAFEYTGTGLELFVGFVIVLFLVVLPITGLNIAAFWLMENGNEVLGGLILGLFYIIVAVLFGAAIYRALMYRLSRTLWRGIRGGLTGSSFGYSFRYFGYTLLQIVTLWLATPYVTIKLFEYQLNNVWLGSGRLQFHADWRPLFKIYLLPGIIFGIGFAVLIFGYVDMLMTQMELTEALEADNQERADELLQEMASPGGLIALGLLVLFVGWIALFWYNAALYRTILAGSSFEGVAFSGKLTGGRFLKFHLFNWFILAVTGGIAYPWVQVRWLNLIVEVVEIHGEPDFTKIAQSTEDMPKFGEGLAEAFL